MDEEVDQKGPMSLKSPVNVGCVIESHDDEDEDEDADFNPAVKEALSHEASSSLSSEIEECAIEGDVKEYATETLHNEDDEINPQGLKIKGEQASKYQKNEPSFSQPEIENMGDHELGLASGTDVLDYETAEELGSREDERNLVFDDDGDAICKRTRARYSLVSSTLDELETFLQETDDDDDLPNVDDDEEYRKFLAAVLLGRDGDQENQTVDDEDEENDADFELEIEEALECDSDEKQKDEAGTQPETRKHRRNKTAPVKDGGLSQNVHRPLRPIAPLIPSAPISFLSAMDRTSTRTCLPSAPENLVTSGFTPHQLGQLHCIIHEHAQLLVQVFSLSIFDPVRQQIASQVQGLLLELIDKRNQALAIRSEPHPFFCFRPPYVHPSVSCELPETWPIQFSSVQSPSLDSIGQIVASHSSSVPFTDERPNNEGQDDTWQKNEKASWLPIISGPLYSILDATPLRLAGEYIHDVKIAMKEYQQRYLRDTCDTQFEHESLFPSFLDPNVDCIDATTSRVSSWSEGASSLPCQKTSKKSFAAELIENSKKQPVALVPRILGKLAQRFFAIFNPALYPRKPPPVIIANRVLFTSAEDELLALGMMEYNTDWKAIQQRFLPCKSKHQIFVRQKNCCSSKAPDNPIKAVRRMKTSPLTVNEVARMREGLMIYKLDWFSIWKFIVPYRDPSLLARQWRIALGTQKSYKSNSAKKERRRQSEAHRRRTKAEMAESRILVEKRDNSLSADHSIENEDEAFVHEAFLADWRPHADASVSSHAQALLSNLPGTQLTVNYQGNIQNGPEADKISYYNYNTPDAMNLKSPVSDASAISKSTFCSRPYRVRRTRKAQMVKLAPDLPALNLPPSVRVMSQSAFKSYHPVASVKVPTSGCAGAINVTHVRPSFTGFGASFSNMGLANQNTSIGKNVMNSTEDNGEADLEMHPLLFQSSGDGSGLTYHPLKFSSGTSSSFSFFNAIQSQTCGSLFRKEQDSVTGSLFNELKAVERSSGPCGIDFHPLLQRAAGAECSTRKALPSLQPSISSELMNEMGAGNSYSLCKKGSELNLEIQLSSSPKGHPFIKEGTGNMRSALESTITFKGTRNLPSAPVGNYPLSIFLESNPNAYTYRTDLAGDLSLDIVMEREELSDSDEEDNEIEENVEFEREEMTDSEPDVESDIEAVVLTQKKEVNSGRNSFTVTADEQASVNKIDFHKCLTLNLTCQDQDSQKSNSKYQTKDCSAPCQSNKLSRKRTPVRKRTRGAAKTQSSVPLALSSSIEAHHMKPRKQVCKSKLSPEKGCEIVNKSDLL